MFEVGWTEMLVIAIVMIVVVGPKDLPNMLRTFGRTTAKLRAMASDFQKQFNDALKEAELDDVKKSVDSLRSLNPAAEIRKQLNPFEQAAADVRSGVDAVMKPKPARRSGHACGFDAAGCRTAEEWRDGDAGRQRTGSDAGGADLSGDDRQFGRGTGRGAKSIDSGTAAKPARRKQPRLQPRLPWPNPAPAKAAPAVKAATVAAKPAAAKAVKREAAATTARAASKPAAATPKTPAAATKKTAGK